MASKYYGKMWLATAEDLRDVLMQEKFLQSLKPVKEKWLAHRIIASLFARYVILVNNLGIVYDQTLQVQKREVLRNLLDAANKRLLEMKKELVEIEISEYIYLDQTLIENKFVPTEIDLLKPCYYPKVREPEIQAIIDIDRPPRPKPVPKTEDEEGEDGEKKEGEDAENAEGEHAEGADENAEGNKETDEQNEEAKKEEENAEKTKKHPKILMQIKELTPEEKEAIRKEEELLGVVNMIKAHEKARQMRVFRTNMMFHPDLYRPKPPPEPDRPAYIFYHKPGTPMLIPVKRTEYEGNFYMQLKSLSKCEFYKRPTWRQGNELSIQEEAEEHAAEMSPDAIISRLKRLSTGVSLNLPPEERKSLMNSTGAEVIEDDANANGIAIEVIGKSLQAQDKSNTLSTLIEFNLEKQMNKNDLAQLLESLYNASFKTVNIYMQFIEYKKEKQKEARTYYGYDYISLRRTIRHRAAALIQRAFYKYRIRKLMKKQQRDKNILFGMAELPKFDYSREKILEERMQKRRALKPTWDANFIKACEDEKNRIIQVRSPWIMEDISDQIRFWFRNMYDYAGEFDKFPPAAKGGTLLIIKGETMTALEFAEFVKQRELNKKKSPEQKAKEKEQAKKKKEAEKAKKKAEKLKQKKLLAQKKARQKKEGKTWDFVEDDWNTQALVKLDTTMVEYEREWRFINEMGNPKEDPIMEWISLDKFAEAHQELRPIVDEFMRIEYELLRMALAKDRKKKYRKPKEKKGKKKGGKKKKQPKDITEDRTYEDLYDELKEAGIIVKYEPRNFNEFIGDLSYTNYERRQFYLEDPLPAMGEIVQVLRFWMLGMGDITPPEKKAKKVKSVLIAGTPGLGKDLLAHAMCTELGAVMMKFTPENLVPYHEDKKYFIHLIGKMSRILQPVVWYLEDAHMFFAKKVPPDMKQYSPKWLGSFFTKRLLKPITINDKIMAIGTTSYPWNSAPGKIKKAFEKIAYMPGTDYGSNFLTWRQCCFNKPGVDPLMDFSALAITTRGYNTKRILNSCNETLSIERRMALLQHPLDPRELLEGIIGEPPPYFIMEDKEKKKYDKWIPRAHVLTKKRNAQQKKINAAKEKMKK